MEPAAPLDLALSGADLSGIDPPDPARLAGLHRRAAVGAALQVLYPAFAVLAFGGIHLGLAEPESLAILVGEAVTSLVGLVAFLYWFFGAYRLAGDLSPYPLDTTPGWSVAQFFIPIVSLFMPYQRMREVEDVNAAGARGSLLDEPRGSQIVAGWWAAWVLSTVVGVAVGSVGDVAAGGTPALAIAALVVGAAAVSSATTALVALHVDAGQQAFAEALWEAEPLAPEAGL